MRERSGYTTVREAFGGAAQKAIRLRLKVVLPDALLCHPWDGEKEVMADVLVAKRWRLRRTPFDGLIDAAGRSYAYTTDVERVVTLGVATETQVVVPAYEVDEEIEARSAPTGGTGVTDAPKWLEHGEGRAWAKVAS